MNLTIIIVNWNTSDMLKECLYSIRKTIEPTSVKTIVVDNSSSDGSREMVAALFPEVNLINSGGNVGFSRANNLAIPLTDTPFILFLNPDTILLENAVKRMIAAMSNDHSVGAVGCKMKSPGGKVQELGLQWRRRTPLTELLTLLFLSEKSIQKFRKFLPYQDPDQNGFVAQLSGGCLLVSKDVLNSVGYFDERFFMYCEDVDLCDRIIDKGYKLLYLSDAEIIHVGGGAGDNTSSSFSTLMKCESCEIFIKKYYGRVQGMMYRLVVFFGASIRLCAVIFFKLAGFFGLYKSGNNLSTAYKKNIAMVTWALFIKKAIIKD